MYYPEYEENWEGSVSYPAIQADIQADLQADTQAGIWADVQAEPEEEQYTFN